MRARGKYTFQDFPEPCATGARETVNVLFPWIGRGVHHEKSVGGAVQVSASCTRVGDGSVCPGRLRIAGCGGSGQKILGDVRYEERGTAQLFYGRWTAWLGHINTFGDGHEPVVLPPWSHLVFSNRRRGCFALPGVSQQHVAAYMNEFVFRFDWRFYPMTAFTFGRGIGVNVTGSIYPSLYDIELTYRGSMGIAEPEKNSNSMRKPGKHGANQV